MNLKQFTLLSFLIFSSVLAAQSKVDSLLFQIDSSISHDEIYSSKREQLINNLKTQLRLVTPGTLAEYELNKALYTEYRPYVCDSAIMYLNKNIKVAQELNDTKREYESKLSLAYLMGSTGMYKEAVDMLETINRKNVPDELLISYYNTYDHVYGELAFYTQDSNGAQFYYQISDKYKDSLNVLLPEDSELCLTMRETVLRDSGKYEEARAINDIRLARVEFGSPEYALVTFYRALSYQQEGDVENEKRYLALSALSDIQSAIKDHASLWMLAQILFEEGDIERAYNYIRFSWNETVFYNARLRSLQSAFILSLIDKTYQAMIEKQNNQLQNYVILVSTLVLLLVIALFYIYRQLKRLAATRKNLQVVNNQLKELNEELLQVNSQLQSTNIELSESNHIKEEYIGRFIKLCSTYIDKLDSYQRMVYKKISAGQTAELVKMTRSREFLDEEFKELYNNFDTAFLQIFPDFVEKVNALLHDEDKIQLKKGELLNTELRILALIRLGIDDSSQIADFLRYSVNTIYNYRAKVKNRAVSREDFESLIMTIR